MSERWIIKVRWIKSKWYHYGHFTIFKMLSHGKINRLLQIQTFGAYTSPRVHNVMKKRELKHIKSMNCSSVVGCGKVEGWGMLHPYPWNKCQGAYFCLTQHGLDVTIRSNSKMGQEAMNLIQSFWFHYLVNVCKIYVFFFSLIWI